MCSSLQHTVFCHRSFEMLPASRASRERGQGTALEPSQGIASPAPLLWYGGDCIPCTWLHVTTIVSASGPALVWRGFHPPYPPLCMFFWVTGGHERQGYR